MAGITRKIDELGRIVLPIEMRNTLDIKEKDAIDISIEGESIILTKVQSACVFCKNKENVKEYRGKHICGECLGALTGM